MIMVIIPRPGMSDVPKERKLPFDGRSDQKDKQDEPKSSRGQRFAEAVSGEDEQIVAICMTWSRRRPDWTLEAAWEQDFTRCLRPPWTRPPNVLTR